MAWHWRPARASSPAATYCVNQEGRTKIDKRAASGSGPLMPLRVE